MAAFCTFLHQCSHCGKTFLTAGYLEAHHLRRHPGITFAQLPNPLHSETERLQSEIKELKDRLNNTERLLHKESVKAIKVNKNFQLCNKEQYIVWHMYETKYVYTKVQILNCSHIPSHTVVVKIKCYMFQKHTPVKLSYQLYALYLWHGNSKSLANYLFSVK